MSRRARVHAVANEHAPREHGSEGGLAPRSVNIEREGFQGALRRAVAARVPLADEPPEADLEAHPAIALGWISLAALARVLGRTNARAARDWCQRHRVAYRRDGKHGFVRVEDVRRALEALPVHGSTAAPTQLQAAAARAAAAMMATRRR